MRQVIANISIPDNLVLIELTGYDYFYGFLDKTLETKYFLVIGNGNNKILVSRNLNQCHQESCYLEGFIREHMIKGFTVFQFDSRKELMDWLDT